MRSFSSPEGNCLVHVLLGRDDELPQEVGIAGQTVGGFQGVNQAVQVLVGTGKGEYVDHV